MEWRMEVVVVVVVVVLVVVVVVTTTPCFRQRGDVVVPMEVRVLVHIADGGASCAGGGRCGWREGYGESDIAGWWCGETLVTEKIGRGGGGGAGGRDGWAN
jgi:hypothetical protein